MTLDSAAVLQVLILAFGIYLVLGFLRTTRGSGLVRGLALSALVAVIGLYALSNYLDLDELDYLFEISSGYALVVLAILFQPELRRGIVHLGENPLLGKLLKGRRQEVLTEIVQAAGKMAAKRQGALIAIERQTPLDAYMESAVAVDAEVTSFLLDTIFHHGSALHDGAVVIRGDRVAAAGCLFPLASESPEINKSTGTRHRAALGVTEESDAITVVVSEETGGISLCQEGKIVRKLNPARLEEELRERLGFEEGGSHEGPGPGFLERIWVLIHRIFVANLGRKLAALAIAVGLFFVANENVAVTRKTSLSIVVATRDTARPPSGDVLVIVLPSNDYHLTQPSEGSIIEVEASGKRAQFERLEGALRGTLRIDPKTPPGEREFPLDEVRWGAGQLIEGLDVSWRMSPPPKLEIERYSRARIELGVQHLNFDTSLLSARYTPLSEEAQIRPSSVQVEGPVATIEELAAGRLPLRFAPLVLEGHAGGQWVGQVGLDPTLLERGLSIVDRQTVEVGLPIVPASFELGPYESEIRLLAVTGPPEEIERWEPISSKLTYRLRVRGILSADLDPSSAAWIERTQRLRLYVEDHLRVFVDVGEASLGEDARVPVYTVWTKDWREVLPEDMGARDGLASLELAIEGEPWVHLIPR